ncbi:unnamed protein product [Blepharisma stoltei]|uniref:Uncharacterized protein n=1 Tax=Blepharisma stoltei TaxID=1481888 RepID=A0AAU9JNG9_9CILI|nr:unnamed protein product [Blepharisma stoltei]
MFMCEDGLKDAWFSKNMLLEFLLPSIEKKFQEDTRSCLITYKRYSWACFIFLSILSASLLDFYDERVAISAISLIPFFGLTHINIHIKRLIAEFACIQFHLRNIETSNLLENIGALFPCFCFTFLCIKQWKYTLFYSIFEAIIVFIYTGQNLRGMIFTSIFYTVISVIFENDYRNIWIRYSCTKKRCDEFENITENSHSAVYILNKEGGISYYNKKALAIAEQNGKPENMLKYGRFQDIFDDDRSSWANSLILNAYKAEGEARDEESTIFKNLTDFNSTNVQNSGFIIKTDIVKWYDQEKIRITFIDVSIWFLNRFLLIKSYKDLQALAEKLLNKLIKCYEKEQPLSSKFLAEFNLLKNEMRGLHLFQSYCLKRIEFKSDYLDFFIEAHNVIEMLFQKASQKRISISLARADNYPKSSFGDKAFYSCILNALINFLIEKADDDSELSISIIPKMVDENEYLLEHYFEFTSHSASLEEFEEIFQIKQNTAKRKSWIDMMKIMKENGTCLFMFDPLICLLRGYTDYMVNQEDCSWLFSLYIPFKTSGTEVDDKKIDITHQCVSEGENYSKWYIYE